jgi:hypothetical protein
LHLEASKNLTPFLICDKGIGDESMRGQLGFFDIDERLRRLSDLGDHLEAFQLAVDFEIFRDELKAALGYLIAAPRQRRRLEGAASPCERRGGRCGVQKIFSAIVEETAAIKNAGGARRLAVQETVRTLGVEAKNPIAHDLQSNAANPRRVRARAAGVNLRKRQRTSGLIGIARSPRQLVPLSRVKVRAKWNRSRHGKPSKSCCHVESRQR